MLNQNTPMFLTYHPMSYRQVPYVLNKIKNIKAHRDSSISGPPRGGKVIVYEDGRTVTPLKTLNTKINIKTTTMNMRTKTTNLQ